MNCEKQLVSYQIVGSNLENTRLGRKNLKSIQGGQPRNRGNNILDKETIVLKEKKYKEEVRWSRRPQEPLRTEKKTNRKYKERAESALSQKTINPTHQAKRNQQINDIHIIRNFTSK